MYKYRYLWAPEKVQKKQELKEKSLLETQGE